MKVLITAVMIIGDPYEEVIKLLQEMHKGVE
jgi:hypothetical protein